MGRTAETAKMVAELDLKTAKFTKGVSTAVGSVGRLSKAVASSRAVAVGLGVGLERIAEKGISSLAGAIGEGIQGALELERTTNATAAVLQSTGNAAGVTAQQIRNLANAQEDLTGVDDKVVQQGENLLLTFRKIGGNIFPDATRAITNFAVAMNKGDAATADLDSAAIKIGKALNDPTKGFQQLARAGVTFDAATQKILKSTGSLTKAEIKHWLQLSKTDKGAAKRFKAQREQASLLRSQKIILAELDKEFGKAGQAAQQGFAGDVNRANDAIEEAKIAIAQGLIPAVGEVARELKTVLSDPAVMKGLKDLGVGIGEAIKGIVAFAKTVPWGTIATSLQAAAGFAKDLLGAFLGLPSWIQTAVITGWGLNKLTGGALNDLLGGVIKGVLGINAGVVNLKAATVVGGGGGGAPAAGVGAAKGLSTLGKVFLVGEAIGLVAAVHQVWEGINAGNSQQATAIQTQTSTWLAQQPKREDLVNGLAAIDHGIADIKSNPLNVLVSGDALQKLEAMRTDVKAAIDDADEKQRQKLNTGFAEGRAAVATAAAKGTADALGVKGQVASSGSAIVGAISRIPAPIVNVNITATTVQKTTTVTNRYGTTSGSRDGGIGNGGGGP